MDASDLIITVGGSTSNSYVSLADLATYRDRYRITAEAFDDAEPDDKIRSLLMAASRLNRENWQGSRASSTQALAWPRTGVLKRDAVTIGYDYSYGEEYQSTEIPQAIKDAQCELALSYLDGFDDGEEDAIDSFSADGVSVKFRSSTTAGGFPPPITLLISGLIQGLRLMRG